MNSSTSTTGSLRRPFAARVSALLDRVTPQQRQVIIFGAIGGANLLLNVALFTVMTMFTDMGVGMASFLSAAITTVLSFFLNGRYAFTSAGSRSIRAFSMFVVVNLIAIGMETVLVAGAVDTFDIRNALPLDAVKVAAIAVGTGFRYFAYKWLVFPEPSTSTAKQRDEQPTAALADARQR